MRTSSWHKEEWRFHDAAVNAAVAAHRAGGTRRQQSRAAAEALWKLRGQTPPEGWEKMDGTSEPIPRKLVVHDAKGIESPNDPPLPQEASVGTFEGESDSSATPDEDSPADVPAEELESNADANQENLFRHRYRRWLLARCRRDATAGGYGRQFDGMSDSELEDVAALEGIARMDFGVWEVVRFSDE